MLNEVFLLAIGAIVSVLLQHLGLSLLSGLCLRDRGREEPVIVCLDLLSNSFGLGARIGL